MKIFFIIIAVCFPLFGQNVSPLDEVQKALSHDQISIRLAAIDKVDFFLRKNLYKKWIPILALALQDNDGTVRNRAGRLLKKFSAEQVGPEMMKLVRNARTETRCLALEIIGELHYRAAEQELIRLLQDDDLYVKGFAADCLGKLGYQNSVKHLIALLKDKQNHRYHRIYAVKALGSLKDKAAVSVLLENLEDQDFFVRLAVIEALGIMQEQSAVKPLLQMTKDDTIIREAIILALKQIDSKRPDLKISISVPPVFFSNRKVSFRIVAENQGDGEANDLKVVFSIPSSFQYISSKPMPIYSDKNKSTTLAWEFPTLAAHSQKNIDIVLYSSRTRCTGKVNLTSQKPGKVSISAETYIHARCGGPAFQISTYDTVDPCKVGQATIYVLECRNNAPNPITGIVLHNKIPKQMEFIIAESKVDYKYDEISKKVVFKTVPILLPRKKLTFKIHCRAISEGKGRNLAIWKYDQFDQEIQDEETSNVCK